MYGQLDLEMISNIPKNERRPSHFHEIWSEEVCYKKRSKKTPWYLNVIILWMPWN
jgi:hypothetical protein